MAALEQYGAGKIAVSDYDPAWPALYEQERTRVAKALGAIAIEIDHVGSTAVPGLAAKPIIDILVTVASLTQVRLQCIEALEPLHYSHLRQYEAWLPDVIVFRKTRSDTWTHHIHIAEPTSTRWEEFMLIRDYLRGHPGIAVAYGQFKQALAQVFEQDIAGYRDAKRPFLQAVLTKARAELEQQRASPGSRPE